MQINLTTQIQNVCTDLGKIEKNEWIAKYPLPEDKESNVSMYFELTSTSKFVPLDSLTPIRARHFGIISGNRFLWLSYCGIGDKRDPVSVMWDEKTGKYIIVDGNSTFANAVASKWESIWVDEFVPCNAVNTNALVTDLIETTKSAEPQITDSLMSVARKFNCDLVMLDKKIKSGKSLRTKIREQCFKTIKGGHVKKIAVRDVLRYTIVLDDKLYSTGIRNILKELESGGFFVSWVRNTWLHGSFYCDVNASVQSPSRFTFEIQFHTKESLKVTSCTSPCSTNLYPSKIDVNKYHTSCECTLVFRSHQES